MRSGHLSLLLGGTVPSYAEISLLEELFLLWPEVTSHFPSEKGIAPFELLFNFSF